ncbi:Uncharacterized protein GBIM_04873, partial [Gryllus bimaculatus]
MASWSSRHHDVSRGLLSHCVHVKRRARDCSLRISWLADDLRDDACDSCQRRNWMKAYENSKDNPYVLGRCAYGFMRLPKPWKDMEVARICVEKGLAKNSSSSFLNYAAAELYNKQNDSDKAKYYFARAAENGCYGACLNLLTLKEKENKLYDAIPDLERYIELFKEKPRQEHLLALLGAYHYFVKSDFNMALKYWSKVIDSDIHSIELKALDNTWPKTPHPCNVSKTIVNEIVQRLDKGCNEEERAMYTNILQKYKKHHRPLVLSIQGIYSERSEYRRYCESENKPLPSTSKLEIDCIDIFFNKIRKVVKRTFHRILIKVLCKVLVARTLQKYHTYYKKFNKLGKTFPGKRSLSILIHKRWKKYVKSWNAINEIIITLDLEIFHISFMIVGEYVPNDDVILLVKEVFYTKLSEVILTLGNRKELILLGWKKVNNEVMGQYEEVIISKVSVDIKNNPWYECLDDSEILCISDYVKKLIV